MPLQSVLFPKPKFNLDSAKIWLRKQGFKTSYYGKPVQDEGNYYRSRQRKPNPKKQYFTKVLPSGIKLVIMY